MGNLHLDCNYNFGYFYRMYFICNQLMQKLRKFEIDIINFVSIPFLLYLYSIIFVLASLYFSMFIFIMITNWFLWKTFKKLGLVNSYGKKHLTISLSIGISYLYRGFYTIFYSTGMI
jgi:hypothetical protein